MATVVLHAVVSVDGFIAGDDDDPGPLFDWYFNGDQPLTNEAGEQQHARFRVSAASAGYTRAFWDSIGATIMGRHLFDLTNGWDGRPPAGEHLIVVSNRTKPDEWHPQADVPFFSDVTDAVQEAKRRAGDRVVVICAGNVGGQALQLGLVDEVAMDVVPVVFGKGKKYFGEFTGPYLLDDPSMVIQGHRVLHLRYQVQR